MRRSAHILAGLSATVLILLPAAPAGAGPTAPPAPPTDADPTLSEQRVTGDGPHRAGLLVDDGDEIRTFCVRFDEEELTGQELMERTDLDLEVTHFGALGAATCAIDGVGCPAGDCFCTAAYWSYWQGEGEDDWSSSPVGSSSRIVRDGDRDARVWSDGRRGPPPFALDGICDEEMAAEPPASPTPAAADPLEGPGAGTLGDPLMLVSFVALLALILGGLIWVRRRH